MTLTSDPISVTNVANSPTPVWRQRLRIFTHNKLAVISVVYLVIITAACYLIPHIDPEIKRPGTDVQYEMERRAFPSSLAGHGQFGIR